MRHFELQVALEKMILVARLPAAGNPEGLAVVAISMLRVAVVALTAWCCRRFEDGIGCLTSVWNEHSTHAMIGQQQQVLPPQ
jgi:hypothetical protein